MKDMKNQKGFSLIELLVVVIIVAIIAAIAIPNLLSSRRAANEASAIQSLRTIHSAQVTYQSTVGNTTDYGVLSDLLAEALIDSALAGAVDAANAKSGYYYEDEHASGDDAYCTTATPASTVTGGIRIFAVSSDGVIYASDADGTNAPSCGGTPLAATGGTALGGVGATVPAPAPAPVP